MDLCGWLFVSPFSNFFSYELLISCKDNNMLEVRINQSINQIMKCWCLRRPSDVVVVTSQTNRSAEVVSSILDNIRSVHYSGFRSGERKNVSE